MDIQSGNTFKGNVIEDSFMCGNCCDRPHKYPKLENKQVLNLPPMPHKRFNKIYDRTRHHNDGQFGDGSDWATFPTMKLSKFGWICEFDGVNDYINCGNDPSLNITDDITIDVWKKLDQLPTEAGVESYILNKTKYLAYVSKASNKLAFKIVSGGTTKTLVSVDALIINTWYHLVMKFDPSTQRGYIYINGVERSTYWGVSVIDDSLAIFLTISSDVGWANGLMDKFLIYRQRH